MQTTAPPLVTSLELPRIDGDAHVAVVPVASAAPLDGRPDGERINLFAVAPAIAGESDRMLDAMGELRDTVLERPLASVFAALTLGFLVGRVLR